MRIHRHPHHHFGEAYFSDNFVSEKFKADDRRFRLSQFALNQRREFRPPDFFGRLTAGPINQPADPFRDDQPLPCDAVGNGDAAPVNFTVLVLFKNTHVTGADFFQRVRNGKNRAKLELGFFGFVIAREFFGGLRRL